MLRLEGFENRNKKFLRTIDISKFKESLASKDIEFIRDIQARYVDLASWYFGLDAVPCGASILISLPLTEDEIWSKSQLFHRDFDDTKILKIFVFLDESVGTNGRLHVVPKPKSTHLRRKTRFFPIHKKDDVIFEHLSWDDVRVIDASQGDIAIVDTFACFHMGSRLRQEDSERVVLQLVYTSRFNNQPKRERSSHGAKTL